MASVLDDLCQTPCNAIDALTISGAEVESLTELVPLSRITKIMNKLEIRNNKYLQNLRGLDAITDVSWLVVSGNPEMTSLAGLGNVENITSMDIEYNPKLAAIEAFRKVKQASSLAFSISPALTDLSSFSELVELETLSIQSTGLMSLQGLGKLHTISAGMSIVLNENLVEIDALSGLQFSGQETITIAGNPLLPQCEALALVAQTTFHHSPKIEMNNMTATCAGP